MGFDPKEPRDKSGKWSGAASGHNAGGGNRVIAKNISNEFSKQQKGKLSYRLNNRGNFVGYIGRERWMDFEREADAIEWMNKNK